MSQLNEIPLYNEEFQISIFIPNSLRNDFHLFTSSESKVEFITKRIDD